MTATVWQVLAGMTRHADAAHLQEAACSTLRNFTLDVGNRAQFSGPEVIGQLLTTMQTHEQVAQVQAQACGALCNLAIANTPMQGMIVANGAIDRVLGAMKTHLESHGVQEEACKLLRILVTGPPHVQLRIAELGGIEQVDAAMKTHPTVSDVQEAACGLLLTLSSQAELAARVEVSGGLVCVKAAGAAAFVLADPSPCEVEALFHRASGFGHLMFVVFLKPSVHEAEVTVAQGLRDHRCTFP